LTLEEKLIRKADKTNYTKKERKKAGKETRIEGSNRKTKGREREEA
jgi:hypothetical protein